MEQEALLQGEQGSAAGPSGHTITQLHSSSKPMHVAQLPQFYRQAFCTSERQRTLGQG